MLLALAVARAEPFVGGTLHGHLPMYDYLSAAPYGGVYAGMTFPRAGFEVRSTWGHDLEAEIPYRSWMTRLDGLYLAHPDRRVDPLAFVGGGLRSVQWIGTASDHAAAVAGLAEEPAISGFAEAGGGVALAVVGPIYTRVDARVWGGFAMLRHDDRPVAGGEASLGIELRPPRPRDRDHDGLVDADDACPERAEDPDHLDDQDGCPEDDVDGDGVADRDDRCPARAEAANGFEDDDGCPDVAPAPAAAPAVVAIDVARLSAALDRVAFAPDSAVLLPASEAALADVVEALRGHPDALVEVRGYADASGGEAYAKAVSQGRAEAVVARLVAGGLDARRLRAVGYGVAPVGQGAPAPTRRIELVLVEGAP